MSTTPRALPAACAALTLLGALVWNEAAILGGLAVVGLWAPTAALLATMADRLSAARFTDRLPSPARSAPE